jgi:hypothetical protein
MHAEMQIAAEQLAQGIVASRKLPIMGTAAAYVQGILKETQQAS